jgi:hypothetical protein
MSDTRPIWCRSHRADPFARALADKHYNRQKPGSPQFVPPGRCLVLLTECGRAFWVTSAPYAEFVRHKWAGAWVCSAFRNEGAGQASELIREALAAIRAHFGDPPELGMVTFIDRKHVRPTMVRGEPTWGYSYKKAGFREVGETKGGLLAFQILPQDMPAPKAARPRSMLGLPLWVAPLRNPTKPNKGGRPPHRLQGHDSRRENAPLSCAPQKGSCRMLQ